MEVLDDGPDVGEHKVGVANNELDHPLPVRLVSKLLAKASGDHCIDDGFVAAEAEDLGPSKCLLDGVAVWGLAEIRDHLLGHSQRNVGAVDAVAKPGDPEPLLLLAALFDRPQNHASSMKLGTGALARR